MGEGKIKTALEKALERAATFKEVSDEELNRLDYMPIGKAIAGRYINNKADIKSELEAHSSEKRPYIIQGIQETLIQNISLPMNEDGQKLNEIALQGLFAIKEDKQQLSHLAGELQHLFDYYLQVIEQVKARVHAQLRHKYQAAMQQLEEQYGGEISVDLESQPEFKGELAKAMGETNRRFEEALQQAKDRLRALQ
ncbi:DUF6657 family protein [Desulfofalx alkaliphila]|uniref:DUF6657 family protein n=1 Tax=Desulfofalx alkaliphila TaxID=105483 RepID=UPI0004E22BC0|nr:DUF6657 family protein [Desulfofalx alkaliphila]